MKSDLGAVRNRLICTEKQRKETIEILSSSMVIHNMTAWATNQILRYQEEEIKSLIEK